MTARARTYFTLSDRLIADLDAIAAEWGIDRSQLAAVWIAEKIREHRPWHLCGAMPVPPGTSAVPSAGVIGTTRDVPARDAPARPVRCGSVRSVVVDDNTHDEGERPSLIEQAVEIAFQAQVAKGARIGNRDAYRAGIRAKLEAKTLEELRAVVDGTEAEEDDGPRPPSSWDRVGKEPA